jgi:hypothetical protein
MSLKRRVVKISDNEDEPAAGPSSKPYEAFRHAQLQLQQDALLAQQLAAQDIAQDKEARRKRIMANAQRSGIVSLALRVQRFI